MYVEYLRAVVELVDEIDMSLVVWVEVGQSEAWSRDVEVVVEHVGVVADRIIRNTKW